MNALKQRESAGNIVAMALPILGRLIETVASETAAIGRGGAVAYGDFSRRKSQGLLELNRLAPALRRAPPGNELREALADLEATLEANRRVLGAQLRASIAVAEIIARAIRDGQSDGTYTAQAWKRADE